MRRWSSFERWLIGLLHRLPGIWPISGRRYLAAKGRIGYAVRPWLVVLLSLVRLLTVVRGVEALACASCIIMIIRYFCIVLFRLRESESSSMDILGWRWLPKMPISRTVHSGEVIDEVNSRLREAVTRLHRFHLEVDLHYQYE